MAKKKRKHAGTKPRKTTSAKSVAPSRASERGDLVWLAGLTVLAWVHRLAFLFSNKDRAWPFTFFYEGDAKTFFHYARALLEGQLYDSGIPFHPPGFPAFLAALHTFLGAGPGAAEIPHLAVKAALALVSSLSVGLLYLVVKPYLGRAAATVAAVLCLYHFGLYVIAIAPVSEGLYLTLLLAGLLLWSRKLEHPLRAPGTEVSTKPLRAAFVLGLLLGALALLRAESPLIAAILVGTGLWGVFREGRIKRGDGGFAWRRAFLPWAVVGLGWVVVVAPWTARNALRLSAYNEAHGERLAEPVPTFVPLTIYGPINLALANRPGADGTFSPDPITGGTASGQLDFLDPRHLEFVLHGDEMALDWILAEPGDFVRLVLLKWGLYLDVFKLGWTQWNWPGGLDGERRPIDIFVPDRSATSPLLPLFVLAGAALSLATPGGARRWAILVLLLSAAGFLTTALFYGYVRQALLLMPFWLSLAATVPIAVSRRLWPREEGRHLPPGLRWAAVAAVVLLLSVEIAGGRGERNFQVTGENAVGSRFINSDGRVRLEVMREDS